MQNSVALIVGRFQPFHKGHLFLIKKALKEADKIIIGIGSANILDVNNPIDFETRKKIIKAVFYKEEIEEKLVKIVPLDDFLDDKKWLNDLKKQIGKFDLALGNNDWTNNILKKAGYKVIKVDYLKRGMYEGWRIRKLIKEKKRWQNRVPKYLISNIKFLISKQISNFQQPISKFNHVVLGGTFDHFHTGHKALLKKAFEVGKKVTIGIATEELYKNKFLAKTIQSYDDRHKIVKKFVKDKATIVPFSEFTGGTDKKPEVDAIVVSRETFPNALKINELRKTNKLKPMMIVIVEDVLAEDRKLISSERIRAGEIDRNGQVFELSTSHYSLSTSHCLTMPESLRPLLQKPLGKIYKTVHKVIKFIKFIKPTQLIAVGDIITDSLLKEGIDPDIKVIDLKSRRVVIPAEAGIQTIKHVKKGQTLINKPGTINLKTAEKLRQMIRQGSVLLRTDPSKDSPYGSWLVVDGEEDLLTLPVILFAPLNSLVLYGHWQHGIIAVEVDEKMKKKTQNLLKKFIE